MTRRKKTTDARKILNRIRGDDPKLLAEIAQQKLSARIARVIYEKRKRANLSQTELAQRAGTTQARISALEDADCQGHTLSMLQRIARVLDISLVVRVNPEGKERLAV